ncbi:M20 family metallopeptidase [Variovorax sp. J22P168]|uniref:M20 family metallopeptidase n=1 Tax=Variovorax jilinensis TaxID=3053513 RepID=UPI0025768669|nr:M20 family metallopeptidase [Variovorax sp. J22P168]MDM0014404.1 M20 family metallopeptidase [Variovorax sp. J22P168]
MPDTADVPVDSIVALLEALVRTPSRAGIDPLGPVEQCMADWLAAHGLPARRLRGPGGEALGLYAEVQGARPGGRWTVLDATLDTAGFGDAATWHSAPTEPRIAEGWLYGRGSADSKGGATLFAHLLREFGRQPDRFAGRLGVLFDLDEHSGGFGGARAFFDHPHEGGPPPRPDGVIIGYPGMDRIVTGGRGFLRARIAVRGIAAHSGASRQRGLNAISRATALAQALDAAALPPVDPSFGLAPQLTLTGIQAGDGGYTQVPDLCELRVDLRLTPSFTDVQARALVQQAVAALDARRPDAPASAIEWAPGWPPYRVPDDDPMLAALREAGRAELGRTLPSAVVGPSNIGNYLHGLGVPALCGFGLHGENLHAADERIALASIEPVYRIYRDALQRLQRP